MGKLKTNKSVHKRFRTTGSGKIIRRRAGKRHLLESKHSKRKRHLRERRLVESPQQRGQIRRLLPYA